MRTTLLAALPLLSACATTAPSGAGAKPGWPALVDELIEKHFELHPEIAVSEGRHELDGQVGDVSAAAFEREIAWAKDLRARIEAFPAEQLDPAQAREREYARAVLNKRLFFIDTLALWRVSPMAYADLFDPEAYVAREYAPLEQRLDAFVKQQAALPRVVEQMRQNLGGQPMPKPFSEVGVLVYGGYADFFAKDALTVFAGVSDQARQARLKEATGKAAAALRDLVAWLKRKHETEDGRFALGPERLQQLLSETEQVTVPLARLEALGRADVERNFAALAAECAKLAPGRPLADCVAQVKRHKAPEGPVAAATRQLGALRAFVIERDLVSVPSGEEARVKETPPYERWNAAAIKIPGPYEKGLPSWYVIAPPDPAWSQQERDDYVMSEAELQSVSVHEVWPGHFLNYLHAKQSRSMLGRLFVGYAFAEGWAHYAEELVVEAGLTEGKSEARVGQLIEALLRDVRLLSAIGLHSGTMTVEQSVQLFRDQGLQDAANAKQQARRGTFDPLYLNYTLGKWMITKLRDDWCASRGGRAAWKQFHDQFLSYGGPPIPMARRWMLGPHADEPL